VKDYELATPNPGALVESLRSVGYSLPTAVADILDNSISAGARNIWIEFAWAGEASEISVVDDGNGMTEQVLVEAMRPGTNSPTQPRASSDLGRFGLGLKTASFSQCRELNVWSKAIGGAVTGRQWDLDYVVKHNEWRLRKDLAAPTSENFKRLNAIPSGTFVGWKKLDRVVGTDRVGDADAHEKFLRQVSDTQFYLEMIFHRHIAGVTQRRTAVNIFVNGNQLTAWDPFSISERCPAEATPEESIFYNGGVVRVRGYVMPHRDKLTDAEFERGAGPRGWIAQQGFYIYRTDRMLLAGDWLRLGRGARLWAKEEHYKLARLSIDIGNSMDLEWSLDVKKSTARPPASLRGRLTGLAEGVRNRAKEVFSFRGMYGPRPKAAGLVVERPWETKVRNNRTTYRINRDHPLIKGVLERLGPLKTDVESGFRLLEETVPVEKIWIDVAESDKEHAVPYEGVQEEQVLADIKRTYDFLRQSGLNRESAVAYLLASEPFNRYQVLVEKL
jgi:hypothetical protein